MQAYLIGALLFLLGIAVFVFQNPTLVTIKFINWISPDVSLAVVTLIAACAGALMIFLIDSFRIFKISKNTRELSTANKKLQNELSNLKERLAKENKKADRAADKADPAASGPTDSTQPSEPVENNKSQ